MVFVFNTKIFSQTVFYSIRPAVFNIPILPATTLIRKYYQEMFKLSQVLSGTGKMVENSNGGVKYNHFQLNMILQNLSRHLLPHI